MLRQKDVIKTLVTKYPLYNFQVRSNNKRLGNLNNEPIETVVKCIYDTFLPTYIETLHPGHARNLSKRYKCVLFTVDSEIFTVISCTHENKGKIFEDDLYELLSRNDPSVQGILDYLKIKGEYRVINTGKINTARNIYDATRFGGETISDITIIEDKFPNPNKEHYLSLKAKNGKTLYSGKSINFINEEFGRMDFDEDRFMTSTHGELFEQLDIDVYEVIRRLEFYQNKTEVANLITSVPIQSYSFVRNLLINSWSYGYHLIFEHKGNVDALDLTQIGSVYAMVGSVNDVKVQYPSHKSKQLSIHIEVDNQLHHIKDNYLIEFRNTKGKILPLEMKVRKM